MMEFPIRYIDTSEALMECIDALNRVNVISLDLEFDKNHYMYGFNICLIQVFDGTTCFLIDPVALDDLSAFYAIVDDPDIEKLCFAFGEDLKLLFSLGCLPRNILDLAIARNIAGLPTQSLTNSLILDVEIHSQNDLQRSNWCKRPLSQEQIVYAAEDVVFLPVLKKEILQQVDHLDRMKWLREEMKWLEVDADNSPAPPEVTYYKEQKEMNLQEWERFKAVLDVRENFAKQLNLPTYKVMDRSILIDLAQRGLDANWKKFTRMHPKMKSQEVKSAFEKALRKADDALSRDVNDPLGAARAILSREEKMALYREKSIHSDIRDSILLPLKDSITRDYGEVLSTFLLSKRLIDRVISGEFQLPEYRKELIRNQAEIEKIDLSGLDFL